MKAIAKPMIISNEASRAFVAQFISELNPERKWSVEVKQFRKKRSLDQNALYWKWLGIVAENSEHSADDLHEAFKAMFLEPKEVMGKLVYTSKDKSTEVFSRYMSKVGAYINSDFGIWLPHPEDQHNEYQSK